jgi:hypothetical protein
MAIEQVKKFLPFMLSEVSLVCSQETTIRNCTGLLEFNPCSNTLLYIYIYSSIHGEVSQVVSSKIF